MLRLMDVLAALLTGLCSLAVAAALCHRPLGNKAALLLLATAALLVLMGLLGPAERELVTTHTFVAYEELALEPSPVEFETGTKRAEGWQWPLPFVGFAVLWAALLTRLEGLHRRVWALPLLLGWTSTLTWLAMQHLAAPAALVQPYALERILWPAGLALAVRIASKTRSFFAMAVQIALGTTLLRLPAALFSKYASDRSLGTSLDIHSIVDIVHPIQRLQFQPPLTPGSGQQQFWLIWAEHVIVFPAFHCMSFCGFAFAIWLMSRHADEPA